jgi:ribosomal protein S18 acetylase RimI-like enzyme
MASFGPLVDLRGDFERPEFRTLLQLLVGWRREAVADLQRLDKAIDEYRQSANIHVLGFEKAASLLGLIAIERHMAHRGVIRHIVVQPEWRDSGVGRALIRDAAALLRLSTLQAETDRNAVGFYERMGFRITSLGEKYPGVERFECTLELR